jgi:hypothetical protein
MGALSLFHPYKPDFRPPQGALTPQRSVRIDPMRHIAARHVFALVVALIVGVTVFYRLPEPLPELTRAEFMAEVRAGHVRRIEIEDQEVIIAESSTRGEFRTGFDRKVDVNLPAELRALGVEVYFSKSPLGLI